MTVESPLFCADIPHGSSPPIQIPSRISDPAGELAFGSVATPSPKDGPRSNSAGFSIEESICTLRTFDNSEHAPTYQIDAASCDAPRFSLKS
jgi:hypothetical protein